VQPDLLRGWADLLAARISSLRQAAGERPLEYANLAVRGRLLGPILKEQVPVALELDPDLVSLIGGGNDILRPAVDVDAIAGQLERAVVRLRARGIDVLLATGMDSADSPLIRATRGRVGIFNSHVWSMARRHGAYVLDVWGMRSLRDWRMWHEDRIHLTTEGHARVAQAALVALGLDPDDEAWDDPLSPLPPVPAAERLRSNVDWLRHHVYPWATRRLRRRSSGDLRVPKRPEPVPLETAASPAEQTAALDGAAREREDEPRSLVTPPGAAGEVREDAPSERTTVSDRIDYTTSDDLVLPEGVDTVRRSRTGPRDVLSGGHPERAPRDLAEHFEEKDGLVGASPDGDPDAVEAYETGQDDGQMV
jgi:lysophospholipase L1-like esterase